MATLNCPYCKTRSVERVRRGPLLKTLFSWLPLRPYRCGKCMRKVYRWVKTPSQQH